MKGIFAFVEDAEEINYFSLLSVANVRERKAEEIKRDMTKLDETLVPLKKMQKII